MATTVEKLHLDLDESRLVLDILREELELVEPPYVPTHAHLNFMTRSNAEGVDSWGFEVFRVPLGNDRIDTRSPITLHADLSLSCHADIEAKYKPALDKARARLLLLGQAREAASVVVRPGARQRPSALAARVS